jgi:peptide methionine sulfoxide reductase msrA/msrB
MENRRFLSAEEKAVILDKETERPYSGQYVDFDGNGFYSCRYCGKPLYRSQDKFHSGCGWPSFDEELLGSVKRILDADGRRIEIECAHCGGHLGHVFEGEGFTDKNTRHCVNSLSIAFSDLSLDRHNNLQTAVFAGGCFWGVEHLMQKVPGVVSAVSGYTGGVVENPTYKEVCTGKTGHAEAVRVVFDPAITSYEVLTRVFFEIHDPTQEDGQGPDLGDQYRSEVFYTNQAQKDVAEKLIGELKAKGYAVVTQLSLAETFWEAEAYHQDYYEHKGSEPYCHFYTKRF